MSENTIEIDLSTWTRRAEVEAIAEARGIPVAEALLLLVNNGLSHGL